MADRTVAAGLTAGWRCVGVYQDIDASKDDNAEVLVLPAQICRAALDALARQQLLQPCGDPVPMGALLKSVGRSTRHRSDHDAM